MRHWIIIFYGPAMLGGAERQTEFYSGDRSDAERFAERRMRELGCESYKIIEH